MANRNVPNTTINTVQELRSLIEDFIQTVDDYGAETPLDQMNFFYQFAGGDTVDWREYLTRLWKRADNVARDLQGRV